MSIETIQCWIMQLIFTGVEAIGILASGRGEYKCGFDRSSEGIVSIGTNSLESNNVWLFSIHKSGYLGDFLISFLFEKECDDISEMCLASYSFVKDTIHRGQRYGGIWHTGTVLSFKS